jgi:hypothetical protein
MTDIAPADRWALTSYANGASPDSVHAIATVRRFCADELGGHADLAVIDVHQPDE